MTESFTIRETHPRWPIVLRLLVMLPGVAAALLPFHTLGTTCIATLAAAIGLVLGERLARSATRPLVSATGLAVVMLLCWLVGWMLTQTSLASLFAPWLALGAGTTISLAGTMLGVVGLLRLAGVRSETGRAIEVVALVAALVAVFASHRDGVVVRPLWLSDFAWQNGIEPRAMLLAIGALTALGLVGLLIAETRRRPNWPTLALLVLLGVVAALTINVDNLQVESLARELGLTMRTDGERNPTQDGLADDSQGEGDRTGEGGADARGEGGGSPEGGEGGGREGGNTQGGEGGEGGAQDPDRNSGGGSGGTPPPMAVVVLGDDVMPSVGGWYLRQETWTRYNGRRLVQPVLGLLDRDIAEFFPVTRTEVEAPPQTPLRQRMRASVSMLAEHTRPFALEGAVVFLPAINPDTSRFRRTYLFESDVFVGEYSKLFGRTIGNPAWTETERRTYLALPDDDRYRALAEEIVATLPEERRHDAWAQAVAIRLWMEENVIYSLQHQHGRAHDAAAAFLFGDRIGYCVHIAHAAVYLMRSLGIPARIGTGYMVPDEQRRGANLIVLGSDAHAWPELYVEGIGWVVFDVTPEQVLGDLPPPLDDDMAELLAELARMQPLEPGQDPQQAMAREPGAPFPWRNVLRGGLLGAMVLFLLGAWAWKLWRRLAVRLVPTSRIAQAGYLAVADVFAEAGYLRPTGLTPQTWAATLRPVSGTLEQAAWRLGYARFAPAPAGRVVFAIDAEVPARAQDREAWLQLRRTAAEELGRTVPRWRRILGLLDPTVPFRVR